MTQATSRPVIGIILDENTSRGGDSYETGKGYFQAIARAGGVAVGLPYDLGSVDFARRHCAGLMSTGARIRFPRAWYRPGTESDAPVSERLEIEQALVMAFLDMDRPYLGICNGMQLLACLSGCRMTGHAASLTDGSIAHDDRATRHAVQVIQGTRLHQIAGQSLLMVNSFHREAVVDVSPQVTVSALAPDGLIEALERPDKRFALGVQWHPERLLDEQAHSDQLFAAFVAACQAGPVL